MIDMIRESWAIQETCTECEAEIYHGLLCDSCTTGPDPCPACGDPIDYCQGHGPIGDPSGHAILTAHDDGDHTGCVTDCHEGEQP